MKYWLSPFYIFLSLLSVAGTPHKNTSVLSSGSWYKIAVSRTGIYRITYDDFAAMGFDLSQSGDSGICIYGNGGGMLPEANSASRPDDLREIPVMVVDGGDGRIDPGDYVLFYGEGPDKWYFNNTTRLYTHSKNLYSDSSYYFVGTGIGKGKRIENQTSVDTMPNYYSYRFDDYAFHELDEINLIKSGRNWYGEQFDNTKYSYDFTFDFPNVDTISPMRLVTTVAARCSKPSKFLITSGSKSMDSISVDYTDLQYSQTYALVRQRTTLILHPESHLNINITYLLPTPNALGWLDYLELYAFRDIRWTGHEMGFRNANTIGKSNITKFILSEITPGVTVWNVTDPGKVTRMHGIVSHDTLSFIIATDTLKEFFAFDGQSYHSVQLVGKVANQDLHSLDPATLIIVTNPLFLEEANRLADFHRGHNNISVNVLKTTQVFNEFASGKPDVTAIRDFMKMLYDRGNPDGSSPKYLLLFGDGSYDPKNRIPENNNMIPTFQSAESMNQVASYVSEDFFGIMGDNEGQGSNGTIDIGIGRFPVTTTEQAKAMVDKIIHYSSQSDTILSDWRNTITFVGDDENSNLHMQQAEQLTKIVADKYPSYNVNKIYLDAYPLISTPAGDRFPDVNVAIDQAIAKGTLIINYTGHGGEDGWAGERVCTVADIGSWDNPDKLPVFITATCEFSRFDNPSRFSAGEMVINKPGSGAIALYSTTRESMATSNLRLDTSFFRNLIPPYGTPYPSMGDLIRISKNNNGNNVNIRNFVLLGDPAQQIAFPKYHVITTEINNHPVDKGADTTRGLSAVNVKGIVIDFNGDTIKNFTGIVYSKILDKPAKYMTLGNKPAPNGSYPAPFQMQNSMLGYVKSSVKNGTFDFTCIIPKDINLQYGKGKISYYARDSTRDANGFSNDIIIGGCEANVDPENSGPEIKMYLDSTNFIPGGRTSKSPVFLASLKDTNGINWIGLGIGHEIITILDGNSAYPTVLNDYFTPDLDQFQSGTIRYPLQNLSNGFHTIRLKAWDFYNNSAEKEISFFVTDQPELSMQQVFNFPNPVRDNMYTTFQFTPMQNAGVLDIRIRISSLTGTIVKTIESKVSEYGSGPVFIHWDGRGDNGSRLSNGMYLYTLYIKGENGTSAQASQKLVILN
jgi:hypothetical protein